MLLISVTSTVYRARSILKEELFAVPCDILVPAARPDSIHAGNVDGIDTKVILQGANIPATDEAERSLHERGILVVPDFIANAGGVICAAVEFRGGTQGEAFDNIAEKIELNTRLTLTLSRQQSVSPRVAAEKIARERVVTAMSFRR